MVRPSGMNRLTTSPIVGRDGSRGLEGAKTVAAPGAAADATAGCSLELCASAGAPAPFDETDEAMIVADGWASATEVSTVGEREGTATAGMSSGLAGVPAAIESLEGIAGESIVAAGNSGACEMVASIPAIVRAGAAAARVSLPFATVVPGIGLGSIAGLDSACADITAAASAAGAVEPAMAGLCIQPKS